MSKLTISECYFYVENKKVNVELRSRKGFTSPIEFKNRVSAIDFIESISKGSNKRFKKSKREMKIYNKKPQKSLLESSSKLTYRSYVNSLKRLQESSESEYRQKVANLLQGLSDLIGMDLPETQGIINDLEVPEDLGIEPEEAISPEVSLTLIQKVEDDLELTFDDYESLTFYFQKEKFQLTKSIHDYDTPELDIPKGSPSITSTIEYMIALLGVNADRSKEVGENSFTFVYDEEVYKIKHIYTGSGITYARSDEM